MSIPRRKPHPVAENMTEWQIVCVGEGKAGTVTERIERYWMVKTNGAE